MGDREKTPNFKDGFADIPLKWKYRDPLRKGPKGQPSKGIAGRKKVTKTAGTGHRRKAYGPW